MITPARVLILTCLLCASCQTAKRVAVTSFRVVDAPARYLREKIDSEEGRSTTTTTTTHTTTVAPSDVTQPGYEVAPPTPTPRPRITSATHNRTTTAPATTKKTTTSTRSSTSSSSNGRSSSSATSTRKPTPSPSPRAVTSYPTARPVPGKPGYVFSLDPNGGMIDVTGYKSGDKARDPYTKQIFIVP